MLAPLSSRARYVSARAARHCTGVLEYFLFLPFLQVIRTVRGILRSTQPPGTRCECHRSESVAPGGGMCVATRRTYPCRGFAALVHVPLRHRNTAYFSSKPGIFISIIRLSASGQNIPIGINVDLVYLHGRLVPLSLATGYGQARSFHRGQRA